MLYTVIHYKISDSITKLPFKKKEEKGAKCTCSSKNKPNNRNI